MESIVSISAESKNSKALRADLVEVNPRLDNANGITSLNAARIIFEILAGYGARDRYY